MNVLTLYIMYIIHFTLRVNSPDSCPPLLLKWLQRPWVLPSGYPLPTYFCNFVTFLTLLARRVVLLKWKLKLEKIRHFLQGPNSTFS